MPDAGRVIVGCTHDEEDPDRVVVSYHERGLDAGELVEEAELGSASALMKFGRDGVATFTY